MGWEILKDNKRTSKKPYDYCLKRKIKDYYSTGIFSMILF